VELVIIKLCYLRQAIELSTDAGGITKKKIVESSLAFRTATIRPLKVESQKSEVRSPKSGVRSQQSEAKLVIEKSVLKEDSEKYKPTDPQTSKLSALDKIRKQIKGNGNNGNGNNGNGNGNNGNNGNGNGNDK
jgi:hypothetical protein